MHNRILLCAWLIVLILKPLDLPLQAAFEFEGLSWPAAAANIKVLGDNHPHRLLANPSQLRAGTRPHLTLQYQHPFEGLDLMSGSLAATHSLGNTPIVGGLEYFGDNIYSELNLSCGTALSLDAQFHLGLSANYLQVQVAEFETYRAFTFSPGLTLNSDDKIRIGSVFQHLLKTGKASSLPQKFVLASEYRTDRMTMLASVEKEGVLPPEFCMAVVASPWSGWQVAMGYRSLSQSFSAGWRLVQKHYGLNYSCVIHPELPASHGFGLELLIP